MKQSLWDIIFKKKEEQSVLILRMMESSIDYCDNCQETRRFANYEFIKKDGSNKYKICEYCGKEKDGK